MFGASYKYELNAEKGTIKLKPTKGLVAASLMPSIVAPAVLFLVGTYLARQDDKKLVNEFNETHPETQEN